MSDQLTIEIDLVPYTFQSNGNGAWHCEPFTAYGDALEVPPRWEDKCQGLLLESEGGEKYWVYVDYEDSRLSLEFNSACDCQAELIETLFLQFDEAFRSIGWEALQSRD